MAATMSRKVLFGFVLPIGCLALVVVLYLYFGPWDGALDVVVDAQTSPHLRQKPKQDPYSLDDVVSIALSRGPCYGECAVYGVVLLPNGTLKYQGTEFVSRKSTWMATYPASDFADVFNLVKAADFYGLKDEYTMAATDLATQTVTVERRNGHKSVSEYGPSGPDSVRGIQSAIDKAVARASGWWQVSPPATAPPEGSPGESKPPGSVPPGNGD